MSTLIAMAIAVWMLLVISGLKGACNRLDEISEHLRQLRVRRP